MKDFFSKISKDGVLGTAAVIILGLILTFFPSFVADTICYVLGTVSLICACCYLYKCIKGTSGNVFSAFSALAYLALGLILIIFQSRIFAALPLTAGICLLVFGFMKLYTAFAFFSVNRTLFKKLLIPAAINAILGILLIVFRHMADDAIIMIIGVILLYCACEGIISKLLIRADGNKAESEENKLIEAEYSDEENKDI